MNDLELAKMLIDYLNAIYTKQMPEGIHLKLKLFEAILKDYENTKIKLSDETRRAHRNYEELKRAKQQIEELKGELEEERQNNESIRILLGFWKKAAQDISSEADQGKWMREVLKKAGLL